MRRMLIVLIGAVVGGLVGGIPTGARGEDVIATPPSADAQMPTALKSLLNSRGALHSGVCATSWTWTIATLKQTFKNEGTWKLVFDYEKGLSRIDRQLTSTVRRQPDIDQVFATWSRSVKRIETPVEMVIFIEGAGPICITPPGGTTCRHAEPFDVRTVGLVHLMSFTLHNATWRKCSDELVREPFPEVSEDQDGKLQLVWNWEVRKVEGYGTPFYDSHRRILWVDPARQFSPVRDEFWSGTSQTPEVRRELVHLTETEWKEKDGTMLPTRCRFMGPIRKDSEHTAELTFEWESVNTPVSETLFTPDAMGAPPGTSVFRGSREGPWRIDYKIGDRAGLDLPRRQQEMADPRR